MFVFSSSLYSSKCKIDYTYICKYRFYTKHFAYETENASLDMCCYSLSKANEWCEAINKWQQPILDDEYVYIYYS